MGRSSTGSQWVARQQGHEWVTRRLGHGWVARRRGSWWVQSRGVGGKIGDMGLRATRSMGGSKGGNNDKTSGWV
nr:hypothetical protein CFP56_46095 [Quercus suber]POE83422.1 hypothetical protein CFP56_63647 [Quercus suber]